MSFAHQVAVITGASSGIGWELAKVLAGQRCKVGLIARRKENLDALAEEIRARVARPEQEAKGVGVPETTPFEDSGRATQTSGMTCVAPADVSDRKQLHTAMACIRRQLGPVDLLIANAGVGMPTLLSPVNIADMEQMIRVNLLGVIYAIEAVLPEMLERRQGHLAAVSSLGAYKGLPGESGYCASKAAVNCYMEGLRIHLRDKGIAVTTICPGFIRTPMTAVNKFHMPWLLEPDDAARRIVRALARRRKIYNFPWQMNLLMKLTRWLPDWLMARTMQDYNENPPVGNK